MDPYYIAVPIVVLAWLGVTFFALAIVRYVYETWWR